MLVREGPWLRVLVLMFAIPVGPSDYHLFTPLGTTVRSVGTWGLDTKRRPRATSCRAAAGRSVGGEHRVGHTAWTLTGCIWARNKFLLRVNDFFFLMIVCRIKSILL